MAYDLKPVTTRPLRGLALRIATRLLENGIFRPLLMPKLLKDCGITAFRQRIPEADPTMHPLVEPGAQPDVENLGLAAAEAASAVESTIPASEFQPPSVADYARAYRKRQTTPEDVAQRVIEAIQASNQLEPPLRAIIKSDADDILAQARESGERIAQGRPRSLLEGVPVAIKDELDMPPYTTDVGTSFLGREVPTQDATAVARLRAAGAMLVGKANMFEIGISPTGNNPIHGFARNPFHLDHDAGGSSSGSGAAVGAGIVPLALGGDGGGSIRIPAAHCGLVGLKPTFGRVSEFGAAPLCWSLAHIGPIGATALDAAIGYAICSGRDDKDPWSMKQPPVHLLDFHDSDLSGITLGVYEPWFEDADPDIVTACEQTLRGLEKAGAVRKAITIEGLEDVRMTQAITILSEMAAAMEPHDAEHRRDFGHATRLNLALAREFTNRDYLRAQRFRTEAMNEWRRVHTEVDAVITPTSACSAPFIDPATVPLGESDLATSTKLMRFMVAPNVCGHPAISFPAGYDRKGLPIGLQAIGRHWEEHLLLRLAKVAETFVESRRPTAAHYDPLGL